MALLRKSEYEMERNKVTRGKNNDLTITGVRVLINLRCSNAIEEQIISRLREIMSDKRNGIPEDEICQQIEKLFKEEFTSVKVCINREHRKEECRIRCPFSINISQDEESGGIGISIREAEDMTGEEDMEVLTISVRRKIF